MTTENKTNDDLKPYKGFLPCRICNYSAPPVLVKTERKHFDAHSYECTRCLFKPETKANQDQALYAWNTRADLAQRVPDGWMVASWDPSKFALLPIEPTEEMSRAGGNTKVFGANDIVGFMTATNCYESMIAAAPGRGGAN